MAAARHWVCAPAAASSAVSTLAVRSMCRRTDELPAWCCNANVQPPAITKLRYACNDAAEPPALQLTACCSALSVAACSCTQARPLGKTLALWLCTAAFVAACCPSHFPKPPLHEASLKFWRSTSSRGPTSQLGRRHALMAQGVRSTLLRCRGRLWAAAPSSMLLRRTGGLWNRAAPCTTGEKVPELCEESRDELQAGGCMLVAASGHAEHSRLDLQAGGGIRAPGGSAMQHAGQCSCTGHTVHLQLLHSACATGRV